jgi:hypothetical protein
VSKKRRLTEEEEEEVLGFVERFQKIQKKKPKRETHDRYDTGDMVLDRLNWMEDNKKQSRNNHNK